MIIASYFLKFFLYICFFFTYLFSYQNSTSTVSACRSNRPCNQYSFIFNTPIKLKEEAKSDFYFSIKPFYISSMKEEEYSPIFLFGQKQKLRIASNSKNFFYRDVSADWLTEFKEESSFPNNPKFIADLSFLPKSNQRGFGIVYSFPLRKILNISCLDGWTLECKTVFNKINHLIEYKVDSLFLNSYETSEAKDFFKKQPNASFYEGEKTLMGFENLKILLNGVYLSDSCRMRLSYYAGGEVPLQRSQPSKYVFLPILGNNGHWGIVTGGGVNFNLLESDKVSLGLFLFGENRFWIHHEGKRVFDLIKSPWSRYLKIVNKNNLPAVSMNEITNLPVKLHPCNAFDLSAGFNLSPYDFCTIRLGYNIWAVSREYINFKDHRYNQCYQEIKNWGIKGSSNGKTSSKSLIEKREEDDISFINLNIEDLDRDSAGSPSGYSQTFFFNINIEKKFITAEAGGFLEWGKKGYILSKKGFWISFSLIY